MCCMLCLVSVVCMCVSRCVIVYYGCMVCVMCAVIRVCGCVLFMYMLGVIVNMSLVFVLCMV